MDRLIVALGPAFAAGFAIQRLLELADPLINMLLGNRPARANTKKALLAALSLVAGLALALGAGLRVLRPLGASQDAAGPVTDLVVTALVISAGTEGINSILKFLGYAKEDKKAQAAGKVAETPAAAVQAINPGPNPEQPAGGPGG